MRRVGWEESVAEWVDSPRARWWMSALVVLLSVLFLGLFVYAAVKRMRYPFEVEWIESGMLVSALRLAHGRGLYVRPTLDFVPFLYTPLYLYVAAAVTRMVGVVGHPYLAQRLVSTVATLGSCAAVYALVMTETRRRVAGVAAAGLFVACYSVVGGFYDIGRVDSLFVMLLLVALLLQRRGYPVVAALVWVLVFQTKQTVLPLAMVILLAEWQRPRRMVTALAVFLVAVGGSVAVLNHATGGWYGFYIFHVARGLPIVARQAALYVPVMVLAPMTLAWGVIGAAVLLTRVNLRSARAMFYGLVSFALIGGVWFVEAHAGASMNAMMPVYAWTAVLFGVSVARLLAMAEGAPRMELLVLLAVAAQLVALVYNPGRYVPPVEATMKGERFVAALRALPGDVYVVNHSYDAVLAGKQPHAEGEALGAVLDAGPKDAQYGPMVAGLRAELEAAMAQHRYTAVVVDDLSTTETSWHFERAYPLELSTGLSPFRYLTSQAQWFLLPCGATEAVKKDLLRPDAVVAAGRCEAVQ